MFAWLYWNPNPDLFIIPGIDWPIKWYGVLFAAAFAIGFVIFRDLLFRFLRNRSEAHRLTDQLTLYVIIGTVVGARLGHFLFYEQPSEYLSHPLEILNLREGGLASHGAAIGIVIALWIFSRRHRGLSLRHLLDFISIPTALAGGLIRVGNFINQEIIGTPTTVPWAVIFGHALDGSSRVPRHPVQLYEAAFYFATFFLLWALSYRPKYLTAQGRLIGLFLILVFGFRFFIEFFKLEQSNLLTVSLTMGQILSVPAVAIGILLFAFSYRRSLD